VMLNTAIAGNFREDLGWVFADVLRLFVWRV